jgi:MFS superfamily sulfate permease-like transporter
MNRLNSTINLDDILFTSIFIGLIVIVILSFVLFLRGILKRQHTKLVNDTNIEQKLDKIITLLENDKRDM